MVEQMPGDARNKLQKLRMRCKTGYQPTDEEMKFLMQCWREWPSEYNEVGHQAMVDTWPVGGNPPPSLSEEPKHG